VQGGMVRTGAPRAAATQARSTAGRQPRALAQHRSPRPAKGRDTKWQVWAHPHTVQGLKAWFGRGEAGRPAVVKQTHYTMGVACHMAARPLA
jgi:hypothetical protein